MKFIDIICLFIADFQDKGDCFMLVCTIVHSRIVSQSWCSHAQLLLVMKHLFWKFLKFFGHFFDWQTNRPMKGDIEAPTTELWKLFWSLNINIEIFHFLCITLFVSKKTILDSLRLSYQLLFFDIFWILLYLATLNFFGG